MQLRVADMSISCAYLTVPCTNPGFAVTGSKPLEHWGEEFGDTFVDSAEECRNACSFFSTILAMGPMAGTRSSSGTVARDCLRRSDCVLEPDFPACRSWSFNTVTGKCTIFEDEYEASKVEDDDSAAGPPCCK